MIFECPILVLVLHARFEPKNGQFLLMDTLVLAQYLFYSKIEWGILVHYATHIKDGWFYLLSRWFYIILYLAIGDIRLDHYIEIRWYSDCVIVVHVCTFMIGTLSRTRFEFGVYAVFDNLCFLKINHAKWSARTRLQQKPSKRHKSVLVVTSNSLE